MKTFKEFIASRGSTQPEQPTMPKTGIASASTSKIKRQKLMQYIKEAAREGHKKNGYTLR